MKRNTGFILKGCLRRKLSVNVNRSLMLLIFRVLKVSNKYFTFSYLYILRLTKFEMKRFKTLFFYEYFGSKIVSSNLNFPIVDGTFSRNLCDRKK